MKRALARRAEKSGLPNGVRPSPVESSPGTQRPLKLSRIQGPPSNNNNVSHAAVVSSSSAGPDVPFSSPGTAGVSSAPSTPRNHRLTTSSSSLKRQRSSNSNIASSVASLDAKDEENDNFSAFYLKQQNRALASELRNLQYQLQRLEQEREFRRTQCRDACQALNSLQATWTQMETALQMGQPPIPIQESGRNIGDFLSATMPLSTGNGTSVELIGALLDALAALGRPHMNHIDDGKKDDMDPYEKQQLSDISTITLNISERAATLQQWIWSLLRKLSGEGHQNHFGQQQTLWDRASQEKELAELRMKCREYQTQVNELGKARDEITASDKKVRKGLYRLASGRMKLEEVLKAIEGTGDAAAAAALEAAVEGPSVQQACARNDNPSVVEGDAVSGEQASQLRKQLGDIEQIAESRKVQIDQLLGERETLLKRINDLTVPTDTKQHKDLSEDDVKRSPLYMETAAKLVTAEREAEELRAKVEKVRENWSKALGDSLLARKTIEDIQNKHHRRWGELTGEDVENVKQEDDSYGDNESQGDSDKNRFHGDANERLQKSKRIAELEHKLHHALENVRQADTARQALADALIMNESLQGKLDEIKGKYAALQAGRGAPRSNAEHGTPSTPREKSGSGSGHVSERTEKAEKSEKMHRENRRMRKELAAVIASKEAAKAKLERAEKDRDSLSQVNVRLLKQSTEKDDMNAKSLSTILHLKHLTEQLTQEKAVLEQQAKSAGQLALAARLATNARERVAEEAMKEKKFFEEKISELEQKSGSLQQEKDLIEVKLSHARADVSSLKDDMKKGKGRCDELATELTKHKREKQNLLETLAVAQRDANAATTKLKKFTKQSPSGSGPESAFTVEQLNTQVSVLKGRLLCPVCNHRDKNCILLRCRHMFCKPCVDQNFKNRSRKCPACQTKFDMKDVEDVWL